MSASMKEHDGATGATGETTATTATKTLWTGFLSFIWDSDSHLKSPEERRLLFKLDCAMLSCLCLGGYQLEHRRVMSRREGELIECWLTDRVLLQVPRPKQHRERLCVRTLPPNTTIPLIDKDGDAGRAWLVRQSVYVSGIFEPGGLG
jgi:hypothetical protein